MPRPRETLTYRLRRLPAYLDRSTVADFLVRSIQGVGPPENLVIFSLASNLVDWERPPTKTATLMFKKTPQHFDNDRTEWTVLLPDQGQALIFDTHFMEFTPLSDCDRNLHQFDCIAISGLASHPLGSWMHRDSEAHFVWLRDRLPKDMPAIRPIIYGYDTKLVKSESVQTIDHLASSFVARLKSVGRALSSAKPLIIVAHSLGGILLRRALIQMASSGGEETFMLKSIKMIFFFGVPSKGMHMSHLLPMVEGQPNGDLIQMLSPGSSQLSSLSQHFSNIATLHRIRLISAYETKRSRTTKMSDVGVWERKGPYELLVDQESAVQSDSDPQDCFPINEDHSDMVKFSDDSPEYRIVVRYLNTILHVVPSHSPMELEQFKQTNNEGSSRPRQSRGPRVFDHRHSAYIADSSPCEPGLHAQSSSKKFYRRRGRKRGANIETPLREATLPDEKAKKENIIKELRDSLDFAERSQRYERIIQAHETTFDWIFEKSDLGLVSWLRKGNGTYWIQGKPGSGKSTVMKFLHDHPKTSEILSQWRQGRGHTSAWFFFNERGSYIEKSLEGLFRSVVRQLITTNKGLSELVLEVYLDRVKQSSRQNQTWHIQDLEEALSKILSQQQQDLEIVLFLDALDEYSGPPEMIADFVQSLVEPVKNSRTVVKVLFSSRPWHAFMASFGQQPGFKMHEETKSDMRRFVLDQLGTTRATTSFLSSVEPSLDTAAKDIVSAIVDRAEGVFLWVRLVIESLMEAGPDATASQLEELLQALPDGLEELYDRTIQRIPRSSRLKAFIVIEIVNRSAKSQTIEDVVLATSCALGNSLEECVEKVENKLSGMDEEQEVLQLKNLCGGLIEIGPIPGGLRPWRTSVQFMHQTVKDFVSRPGFEHHMLHPDHAPLYENGFSFITKYTLARHELSLVVGSAPGHRPAIDLEYLMSMAHSAEETTGNHQEKFLDTIGDERFRLRFIYKDHDRSKIQPISILSFAVLGSLLLYTRQKLRTMTLVNSSSQKSLLHFAVQAAFLNHPFSSVISMMRLLLENGADVNHKFAGETPFQSLFHDILGLTDLGRRDEIQDWSGTAEVVGLFLEYGQDANVDIPDTSFMVRYQNRVSVCKPLHVSRSEVSKILLEHGAQVNALDGKGLTALDRLIITSTIGYRAGDMPSNVPATASILLEHGGCITHSTKGVRLATFLERVSARGWEVPDNPPQLPMTLAQRVRNILPSYLVP